MIGFVNRLLRYKIMLRTFQMPLVIPSPCFQNIITNLAVTSDFQQCGILKSVDSDEPVQPPLKLRKAK